MPRISYSECHLLTHRTITSTLDAHQLTQRPHHGIPSTMLCNCPMSVHLEFCKPLTNCAPNCQTRNNPLHSPDSNRSSEQYCFTPPRKDIMEQATSVISPQLETNCQLPRIFSPPSTHTTAKKPSNRNNSTMHPRLPTAHLHAQKTPTI